MQETYSKHASQYAAAYELASPEEVHASWLHLIPKARSRVLDVGAGSGRDAAWLASKGHHVTAVEPSKAMRETARKLHPDSSVRWINDALPALDTVHALKIKFDLILANAVWIHVSPPDRTRAMASLASLLEDNGVLIITLRHGPSPDKRIMHDCSEKELARLAQSQGLEIILQAAMADALGRKEVTWTHMAFIPRADIHEK
ncbi:MAG: class I SAM-dependent methyltransferase [Desulfatibacillum sp.]|nr:class I SAM-dependent methyltransferase [Desulfatibacillum sp.]